MSARPDGPHRYRCSQKLGHQCHHHHPVAGDVHAPPSSGLPNGRRNSGGGRWSSNERGGGRRGRSGRETPGDLLEGEVVPDLQEGGEGPLAGDPALQVVVGAAQSP